MAERGPTCRTSASAVTASGGVGVVFRFGWFYGADSPESVEMLRTARRGWLTLPGPGGRYTSMNYLDDAARGVVAALDVAAGVYNAVEDEPPTVGGQANVLADLIGGGRVRRLPAIVDRLSVMRAGAVAPRRLQRRTHARVSVAPSLPQRSRGLGAGGRRPRWPLIMGRRVGVARRPRRTRWATPPNPTATAARPPGVHRSRRIPNCRTERPRILSPGMKRLTP